MRKLLVMMSVIISGTFLSNAIAATPQPTFGGVTAPDPATSGQVMSNDAYKGTVEKMGNETNQALSETVQQQVKASSSGGPSAPIHTAPPSEPSTPATPTTPTTPTPQPAGNPDDAEDNAPGAPTASQPPVSKPTAPAVSTPAAPANPQPSEPYTGFSGQTNPKTNNTGGKASEKSSNWNVGY